MPVRLVVSFNAEPGKAAELLCAGRFDRRSQALDDRLGGGERDTGPLIRLRLARQGAKSRAATGVSLRGRRVDLRREIPA